MRSEPPQPRCEATGRRCEASPAGRGVCDAKRAPEGSAGECAMRSEPTRGDAKRAPGRVILRRVWAAGGASGASLGGSGGSPPRENTASQAQEAKGLQAWSDAGWLRGQTTRRRMHRRSDGGPERRRCSDGGPEHRYACYTETPPCASRPDYKQIWHAQRLGGRSGLSLLLFRVCFLAKRAGWLRPGGRRLRGRPLAGHPVAPGGCSASAAVVVGPKSRGASGLTAAVGDHHGEIGDGDSTDRRNRRPPAGALHEQGNRGRKTSHPDSIMIR